jgi:hypothetical protein
MPPRNDPALREDHPEHADQGLPRRRGTSPATSAPSKRCSTAMPWCLAPPRLPGPGSTTTSVTAGAPTPSSSNARTAWPAPNATSTPPRTPPKASSWKPAATCSRCWQRCRLPTTNAPQSTTAGPHWTSCSTGSPTCRPCRAHPSPDRRADSSDHAAHHRRHTPRRMRARIVQSWSLTMNGKKRPGDPPLPPADRR